MYEGRETKALVVAAALIFVGACSDSTRYRVLSFFLDGVSAPGSTTTTTAGGSLNTPRGGVSTVPSAAATPFFAHAPYRENRCGSCHDAESGQLTRTISDGLCLTCHAKVVEQAYVHGPAAVNDCTVCHHYHGAPFLKLLLVERGATCAPCHERDDLTTGEHHAGLDTRVCLECHDPHGGENRYFIKGVGP